MTDYRPNIGRHYANDDRRLWEFTRDSKIPIGYFDTGFTVDSLIVIECIAFALIALAAMWLGYL